jgi:hypothetical protein
VQVRGRSTEEDPAARLGAGPGSTAAPREQLLGVTATSAGNAWVTGQILTSTAQSVVLRWAGTAWSQVRIPDPAVDQRR